MSNRKDNADEHVFDVLLNIARAHDEILKNAPVAILIIDGDGKILAANSAAKQSIGVDPVGKTLFELFSKEVAMERLRNIRKAIDGKKLVIGKDERDYRHFLTYYHPVELFKCCVVMAIEITDMVRIQQLLETTQNIKTRILRTRDPKKLLEYVCETIGKLREISYVEFKLSMVGLSNFEKAAGMPTNRVLKCLYVDESRDLDEGKHYEYFFTLSVFNEVVGKVTIRSRRIFSDEELQILQTLFDDVVYVMKLNELSIILARNIVEIAHLVDGIRNPLSAILLNAELYADKVLYEKIREQVLRVIDLLRRLDNSWTESEKIIKTLRLFSDQ